MDGQGFEHIQLETNQLANQLVDRALKTFPTYRAVEGRQGQGRQASSDPGCVCQKVQEKFRFLGLREEDQACYKKGHQATMVSSALLEQIFEDNFQYSKFFSGFTGR